MMNLDNKNKEVGKIKSQKNELVVNKQVSFELSESFKLLRTNIAFSLPDDGCKVIGVVGAIKGIGKSFVAAQLVNSFSDSEQKVLLIDADLRRPTIADKMGLARTPGLSNFLAGVGLNDASEIIQKFSDNIDVITAGNIPPNPSELLGSEKMHAFLEVLKKKYDYIIFDLPPVTLVSDALVISKFVHGFVLVVRQNVDEKKSIREMMRQFELAQVKILGFVMNSSAGNSKHYDKYYYSKKAYYR